MVRLLRHDRENEAVDLATAGAALRPADAPFLTRLGDAFGQSSRWSAAGRFYRQAWEIAGDEAAASRYVDALVKAAPQGAANAAQYGEALRVLSTPALNIDGSMNLLMVRAGLYRRQGRQDAARGDSLMAFGLVGEDPRLLMGWSDRLRQIYTDAPAAMAILNAVRTPPSLEPWVGLVRGVVLGSEAASRSEGISLLQTLSAQGASNALRVNAIRALTTLLAEEERWQEALDFTRQGLALSPDDLMLNNNAAFFLSEKLNNTAEGLPFAEKAAAIDPNNRTVLDTLASLQWQMGQRDKAIQSLSRALRVSRTEADTATTAIKLGGWKLQSGDRTGAVAMAQRARELIAEQDDIPELRTRLNTLLQDLKQGR
jgi:tetratricopeptide (TPR) repeat protein